MHKLIPVFFLSFSLLIASCGPIYKTEYQVLPPKTTAGGQCANQCLSGQSMCKIDCRSERRYCEEQAREEAHRDYRAYLKAMSHRKDEIEKDVYDFEDFYHCRTSCEAECDTSYRQCHTNCGGEILTTRTCTAFCEE